jgi:hypothetical protein
MLRHLPHRKPLRLRISFGNLCRWHPAVLLIIGEIGGFGVLLAGFVAGQLL